MNKTGRMIFIFLLSLILLIFLVAGSFLAIMTLWQYKPEAEERLKVQGENLKESGINEESVFTFLTWNIGYSGLGKGMDFFYEGGKRVRPEKNEFTGYFTGIKNFVSGNDSIDFIYLQEVDTYAKRSYRLDEVKELSGLKDHYSVFALNYVCAFVPLPVDAPMGFVKSGIMTLSRFKPDRAERIAFTSTFPWPKNIFFLKRCFIVMKFQLPGGKEMIVINTHNSTFDKNGELRKVELAELRQFAVREFLKGNYVILGGDWNNNPTGFSSASFTDGNLAKIITPPIDPDFLSGWKFAFDPSIPSNRDVDMPYIKGITKTTIIDFFVLSPNIELLSLKTAETGFAWSDHQPVIMKIRLSRQ